MSTLELDIQISADGVAIVSHERVFDANVVEGPFVGEHICRLTREQCQQMTCGGEPIATLDEVIQLVFDRSGDQVSLNIETKFDVLHPDESAPRLRFVEVLLDCLTDHRMVDRASVQCFDWWVLDEVGHREPGLQRNVLANTAYLERGEPGASPWMDGLDIDDFAGSLAAAASARGYDAISPSQTILTPAMIREAHLAGLRVIPYTVDDPATLSHLIGLGVDGVITNRPDLARAVLAEQGLPLPTPSPPAR